LEDASDSDIFITSVVPLQLHSTKTSGDKIIHWQNPRPPSVRYCHPIQIQFKKETTQLAEKKQVVEERIKELEKMVINLKNKTVSYLLVMTWC
jgi:hypothetical protein